MKMKTAVTRTRRTLRIVELALLLGTAVFLLTGAWALNTQRDLADRVVRLHVLANSDTEEDQALKLLVRDAVLERATEILEQSEDRRSAEALLRESLPELEALAAGLTEDQVSLMAEEDSGYVLKFKAVEWWEQLREWLED